MCWINWFIKTWKNKENCINLLKNMNKKIAHRWPDDEWFFVDIFDDKIVWLSQVRLSILDLSNAWHQPMFYDKNVWAANENYKIHESENLLIVYNWEIYNYIDLKKDLENKWYVFSTKTDTEIILASYLEYWEKCILNFNWMWSFVIYDKLNNKIFASRDRLWKKPFYYYFNWNNFIFSSEIKGILEHKELNINLKENIDKEAIDFYFTTWFIPSPWTIYKDVKKLEARHNLVINLNNWRIDFKNYSYYEIPEYTPIKDKIYLLEEAKKLLKDSVKIRMLTSDVSVWAFLSWWLDSSSIVSEMIKSTKKEKLNTFSIWFEWTYDESEYINIVKEDFWTKHHHEYFKKENFDNMLDDIYYFYDEPFADYSNFPTTFVSQLASEFVTVSLSWDWWDEIFGWYIMHQVWAQMDIIYKIPKFLRKILYFISPKVSNNLSIFFKIKEAFRVSLLPKKDFYSNIWGTSIYKPDIYKKWASEKLEEILVKNKWNFTQSLIDFDLLYNTLWDNFLVKVDRASMSKSLEIRSPFLDYRWIEWSRLVPTKWKVNWKNTKILMREIIKDIVPVKIINRWKKWFEPPIKEWILENKYISEINNWLEKLYKNWVISEKWYKNLNIIIKKDDYLWNEQKVRVFLFIKWYEKWIK